MIDQHEWGKSLAGRRKAFAPPITQAGLAQASGVSKNTVCRLERGTYRSRVTVETYNRINSAIARLERENQEAAALCP